MNLKNHSHVIAAYLRLSKADGDLDSNTESNSISNQRKLIKHYLLSHPDLSERQRKRERQSKQQNRSRSAENFFIAAVKHRFKTNSE